MVIAFTVKQQLPKDAIHLHAREWLVRIRTGVTSFRNHHIPVVSI